MLAATSPVSVTGDEPGGQIKPPLSITSVTGVLNQHRSEGWLVVLQAGPNLHSRGASPLGIPCVGVAAVTPSSCHWTFKPQGGPRGCLGS